MKWLDLLLKLSPALESGKALSHAEGWSNVALANHAIVAVLGFILVVIKMGGYEIPINDDQLTTIAGAIASIGGTVVAYLHVATNENKGIKR